MNAGIAGLGGAGGAGAVNSTWAGLATPAKTTTIRSTKLDEPDVQELLRTHRFVKYLINTHPQIGELWDAFAVAERLEK